MSRNKSSMVIEKLPGYFLIACVLLSLYFALTLLAPISTSIIAGVILTITFYPLYAWILKKLKGKKSIASFLTCFIVVAVTVSSLTVFAFMIAGEASATYDSVIDELNTGKYDDYLRWGPGNSIYDWLNNVAADLDLQVVDVKGDLVNVLGGFTDHVTSLVTTFFGGLYNFVIGVLLMFFAMFFFFRDSDLILDKIIKLSPLPEKYEVHVFGKVRDITQAVMLGVFLTAVLQGLAGGVGFMIIGLDNPIFWATVLAIFSLVPVLGTAVVLAPMFLLLLLNGQYWQAIFIGLWGALVVGSIDNFIRPLLIDNRSKTYFPLMFFLIFGALFKYNIAGVIVGPLALVILMAFLYIYEEEYAKDLNN